MLKRHLLTKIDKISHDNNVFRILTSIYVASMLNPLREDHDLKFWNDGVLLLRKIDELNN